MFSGSIVAVVTPMLEDGSLDLPSFKRLLDWHVDQGTDGVVVVGTTGESPTVTVDEHCVLIQTAVEQVARRMAVIAGTGANSTAEAIELTAYAQSVGVDACLSVVPYYNKPTQEGLYRHFKAIAEAVDIPLVLYNVPGRTVADMHNDTVLRLADIDNVVGIKDATGDIGRGTDLILRAPRDFAVWSGDDASTLALMFLGAIGCISVTANVAPKAVRDMCACALAGRWDEARALNVQLFGLHTHLFVEANPIPVKWALYRMGLISQGLRLPMTPLSPASQARVDMALRGANIPLS